MRYVEIDKISKGMLMGRNIYNESCQLVLRENSILTEHMISRLRTQGYQGLYISDEISKDIVIREQISQELKNRTKKSIKALFDSKGKKLSSKIANNISAAAREICDEIIENKQLLGNMIELKTYDDYTYSHSLNVGVVSTFIGEEMGLNREQLYQLALAGMLHDIGKEFIPIEIINKTDKLETEEWKKVQSHPELGYHFIRKNFNYPATVYVAILMHHENYNGTGYPGGKEGEEISLFGRIIRVADTFDALTSTRSYRKAYASNEAVEYIMAESGTLFDPNVVEAFIRKTAIYPVGTEVRLSTGEKAIVMKNYEKLPLRPKVLLEDEGKVLNLKKDRKYLSVTIEQEQCEEVKPDEEFLTDL